MFYKILSNKDTTGKIIISTEFLKEYALVNTDWVSVNAGHNTQKVQIIFDTNLNKDEFFISQDILEKLSIPTDVMYQVRIKKNNIRIGPVIGLLMARNNEDLTKARLRDLLNYCIIYPEIKGLILALSVEGIDFNNRLVKGYYYYSDGDTKNRIWKEGVFPFPDSFFHRISLPEDIRIKIKAESNNNIFNSNHFNKWEFWNMISKYHNISEILPYTRLLSSIDDIDFMLSRYDAAYLKPLNGTLSRGLYKVTCTKGVYAFQGKQGENLIKFTSREETEKFVGTIMHNHRYLIQQALNPVRIDGRHLDFRVIMQKDQTLTWKCTGIIAFIGARGDICTNWGYTAKFEDVLSRHFNFSQQEIFRKKQEVVAACRNVCKILDFTGENYGDFGFDVLIDEAKKVWILETNKRHYHTVPLWIDDVQTFYEVKSNPVKYAAALGGFDVY